MITIADKYEKIIAQCSNHFLYVLTSLVIFSIITINLLFSLSKYHGYFDKRGSIERDINDLKGTLETNKEKIFDLTGEIDTIEKLIEEARQDILKNKKELEGNRRDLELLAGQLHLEESLSIDRYIEYSDDSNEKFIAYINFFQNGEYAIQKAIPDSFLDEIELVNWYSNHYSYFTDKDDIFLSLLPEKFNLTEVKQTLLKHQIFFEEFRRFNTLISEEESRIKEALKDDETLKKANENLAIKQNQIQVIRSENTNLENRLNQLNGLLLKLNQAIENANEELSQSHQVSGVPITSFALIPLMPIILVVLYLWFLLHFNRFFKIFKRNEQEAGKKPILDFPWFVLYREKVSAVFTYAAILGAGLFSVAVWLLSLLYIKPLISSMNLDFQYSLTGIAFYVSTGLSAVVLLLIGVITILMRRAVLQSKSIIINE